jgi:hypothetical protein
MSSNPLIRRAVVTAVIAIGTATGATGVAHADPVASLLCQSGSAALCRPHDPRFGPPAPSTQEGQPPYPFGG